MTFNEFPSWTLTACNIYAIWVIEVQICWKNACNCAVLCSHVTRYRSCSIKLRQIIHVNTQIRWTLYNQYTGLILTPKILEQFQKDEIIWKCIEIWYLEAGMCISNAWYNTKLHDDKYHMLLYETKRAYGFGYKHENHLKYHQKVTIFTVKYDDFVAHKRIFTKKYSHAQNWETFLSFPVFFESNDIDEKLKTWETLLFYCFQCFWLVETWRY